MSELLAYLWQSNIELSLLLVVIFLARLAIRKTTKNYNAYLLWLSIPIGVGIAKLISYIDFSQPPTETVNYLINSYVVKPSQSFDGWNYVAYLWLSIVVLLLIRLARQHKALRKELKQISVPHHLIVKSKYPIIGINKDGFSPAVYGFIKPRIYFPIQLEKQLSFEQLKLIIQHEEHHISQKHLWLNLLWDILVCLVWFNPLIYVSRQNFRHDQEVYCDYLVLNRAPEPEHKTYGHALLSTVSATHSVSLLCSWKMFNQLEERIMSIKNVKRKSNKLALSIGAIAIIASTSLYAVNMNSFKQLDKDGEHRVEWSIGGKSYVEKDGGWVIYENGKKRSMTAKEKKEFEQAVERAEEEMRRAEKDMLRAEQEMERAEVEMEKAMEEMEKAHEEMARGFEQMEEAFMEIEQSQMDIHTDYLEGKLSKEQLDKIQAELRKAQEQLKQNQGQYQRDIERAKQQLEKSRRQLEKGQTGLRYPKAPVSPVEPVSPASPESSAAISVSKPAKPALPVAPEANALPKKTVPAKYPVEAERNNISGYTTFQFDLTQDGKPINIAIIDSQPAGVFDEVAKEAIENWEFIVPKGSTENLRYKIEFAMD
ncbi:MAG: TonB family protein [Gammaproteobacteria bacterium]|nr:TonB family protein [Gammaproteobacteria bacterium]